MDDTLTALVAVSAMMILWFVPAKHFNAGWCGLACALLFLSQFLLGGVDAEVKWQTWAYLIVAIGCLAYWVRRGEDKG